MSHSFFPMNPAPFLRAVFKTFFKNCQTAFRTEGNFLLAKVAWFGGGGRTTGLYSWLDRKGRATAQRAGSFLRPGHLESNYLLKNKRKFIINRLCISSVVSKFWSPRPFTFDP